VKYFVSGFLKHYIKEINDNKWTDLFRVLNHDYYPNEIADILVTLRDAGIDFPMNEETVGLYYDLYKFPYEDNSVLCSMINNIPSVKLQLPPSYRTFRFGDLVDLLESKQEEFTESNYLLETRLKEVEDIVSEVFYCYYSNPIQPEDINVKLYIVGVNRGNVIELTFDSNDNLFMGCFYPNCGYAFDTRMIKKCAQRLLDTCTLYVEGYLKKNGYILD
jgi:hypothetical protein